MLLLLKMPTCAVAGCVNSNRYCKNSTITFHRFPSDEAIRKTWLHACKRADSFSLENARVCSDHFDNSEDTEYQ